MASLGCGSNVIGGGAGHEGTAGEDPGGAGGFAPRPEGGAEPGGGAPSWGGAGGEGASCAGWRLDGSPKELDLGDEPFRLDSLVADPQAGYWVGTTAFIDAAGTVEWRAQGFGDTDSSEGPIVLGGGFASGGLPPVELSSTGLLVGTLVSNPDLGTRVGAVHGSGLVVQYDLPVFSAQGLSAMGETLVSFIATIQGETGFENHLMTASEAGPHDLGPIDWSGFLVGRRSFSDGQSIAVWADDQVECVDCPLDLVAQRFDEQGRPVGSPEAVLSIPDYGFISPGPRLAATPAGDGLDVVVASDALMRVFALDGAGVTTASTTLLSQSGSVDAVGIAELEPGVRVVSYLARSSGGLASLHAVVIGEQGALSPVLDLGDDYPYGATVRVASVGGAAIVVADSNASSGKQVLKKARIARCTP